MSSNQRDNDIREFCKIQFACKQLQDSISILYKYAKSHEELQEMANSDDEISCAIGISPAMSIASYLQSVQSSLDISEIFAHYEFDHDSTPVDKFITMEHISMPSSSSSSTTAVSNNTNNYNSESNEVSPKGTPSKPSKKNTSASTGNVSTNKEVNAKANAHENIKGNSLQSNTQKKQVDNGKLNTNGSNVSILQNSSRKGKFLDPSLENNNKSMDRFNRNNNSNNNNLRGRNNHSNNNNNKRLDPSLTPSRNNRNNNGDGSRGSSRRSSVSQRPSHSNASSRRSSVYDNNNHDYNNQNSDGNDKEAAQKLYASLGKYGLFPDYSIRQLHNGSFEATCSIKGLGTVLSKGYARNKKMAQNQAAASAFYSDELPRIIESRR